VLELHQRAAFLPTEPPLTWLHFVRARFLGELRERDRASTVGLTLQSAVQQSETSAEVRGILEFSADGALPVVYDCAGSLNLATQELSLEDSKSASYEGRFSVNGRVISLTRRAADGARSKPFHLIESGTLAELL
jgi:hypothetical protein